ncbi:uncharacterized protein BN697_01884 [Bacteroides sp. CAG:530]|nr:uncharacterized protein BN697_01884 [Bacteroides sp. CAG:530]
MDEQLKKYFSGELSTEEKRILFNRIQSEPDLKRDFVRLQNAEAISHLAEQDGDNEWASAKLNEWQERLRKKNAKRRNFRIRLFGSVAAVLLLLVLPFSWYYGQWQNDEDKNSLALYAQQFVPQDAQQIKVFLSPTEEVSVNANKASVSYSSHGSVSINNQNYGNAVSDTAGLHMAQTLKEKEEPAYNQIVVPKGKFTNLRLSDGTLIYINSASRVVYPKVFHGNRRQIYIEGEAYLEVAKDKHKPFIVQTSTFEVEVLGTSFNVNAYKEDTHSEVVLLEGSVRLSDGVHPATMLKPDQMAVVNAHGVERVRQVNASDYVSWKDGLLPLHSEELSSVCKRLERFYGCRISISPSAGCYRMRGKIDLYQPLDELLRLISITAPVQWHKNNDGIYFIENK